MATKRIRFLARVAKTFFSNCAVYKSVSFYRNFEVNSLNLKEKAQNWLKYSLDDPIVKILEKNSNLTKIQLETLLIDVLVENIADKSFKYDEKARIRFLAVSRGSFNRSLRQARRNVIKSIYTILLLGYLGILEEISLDPYIEIANRLQTYVKTQRNLAKKTPKEEQLKVAARLHQELKKSLEALSEPRSMSGNL